MVLLIENELKFKRSKTKTTFKSYFYFDKEQWKQAKKDVLNYLLINYDSRITYIKILKKQDYKPQIYKKIYKKC